MPFGVFGRDLESGFGSGLSLPHVDGAEQHSVSGLLGQVLQAGRFHPVYRVGMVSFPLGASAFRGRAGLFARHGWRIENARHTPGQGFVRLSYEEEPPHRRRMGNLPELRILSANPARRHVLPACNMFAP